MMLLPKEAFGRPLTSLAFLWRLVRADGVALGFTSHDRAITLDGLAYRCRPGVSMSALESETSLEARGPELRGVLSADGVSSDDLLLGRWEDGRVEIMLCDWEQPAAGVLLLMVGRIAAVAIDGAAAFTMELEREELAGCRRGPLRCSPLCRAELGDARCGVDMAGRFVDVGGTVGGEVIGLIEPLVDFGRFLGGTMRVLTGPSAGVERRIDGADDREVALDREIVGPTAEARIRLTEGCDKRFETCVGRFGNGLAFDGEPHVPGRDALVRYGTI